MKKHKLVCTVCPISCHMILTKDSSEESGYKVEGATCKRGIQYGIKELINPTRLITSTVRFWGNDQVRRLPVRTDREIPKEKIQECMKIINNIDVNSDVKMGDILYPNLFGSNVNIIASKSISTNIK